MEQPPGGPKKPPASTPRPAPDLKQALAARRLAASTETVAKVRTVLPEANVEPREAPQQQRPVPRTSGRIIPPPQRLEAPAPAPKKRPQAEAKAPAPEGAKLVAWDPKRLRAFLSGVLTLGELEGISRAEQYEMARFGHNYLRQGKLEKAERIFEGLVVLNPRDAYFHLALGAVAQRRGDLEAAERAYSRSIELDARSPHAFAHRGEVRLLADRLLEGTKDLFRALELDPQRKEPTTKRAAATLELLRTQVAEAEAPAAKPTPARADAPPPSRPARPAAPRGSAPPAPRRAPPRRR